jgi:hypothetical protein
MRDHAPIEINQFNGLWNRGRFEAVPPDHCSDLLNIKFTQDGLDVRDGFGKSITLAVVKRMWVFKVYGAADRTLILDGSYNIWDSTSLATPILTVTGMTDFAAVGFGGRAYISPHNGITGLPSEHIYVYKGSGTAVLAGGVAPTGTMTASLSATTGHVEAGTHVFAVAFETDTGFITAPGPASFPTVAATGTHKIDLAGIPTGPANTSARWIIATKFIETYNGNQLGYEFFFVPNGRIANNTATTLTVDFYDIDLLSSADYLFDLFDELPATLWLGLFHGRLMGGGENANPSIVRISQPGQPEAINEVTGLLTIDPANTSSPVVAGQELRDALYLFKKTRTYTTSDNGAEPVNWQVITLDEATGTDVHGIAVVTDSGGVNIDKMFIADRSGFMLFTGVFSRPELSWKINDIWKRINQNYFYTIDIAHDPTLQRVYIAVPLDSATSPSHILVMDYANYDAAQGTLPMAVRWSIWTVTGRQPTAVIVQTSTVNNSVTFKMGSKDGYVYELESGRLDDDGVMIPAAFAQFGIIPKDPGGTILHAGALRYKIRGSGTLTTTLYDRDKAISYIAPNLTLAALPGREPTVLANFKSQGFIIRIGVSSYQHYFQLNGLKLFVKAIYDSFPG